MDLHLLNSFDRYKSQDTFKQYTGDYLCLEQLCRKKLCGYNHQGELYYYQYLFLITTEVPKLCFEHWSQVFL